MSALGPSGPLVNALLYGLSSFANTLTRKRELVALPSLSLGYIFTVNALWLFLMMPWVGLQFNIVVFPDQTHLLFESCVLMALPWHRHASLFAAKLSIQLKIDLLERPHHFFAYPDNFLLMINQA